MKKIRIATNMMYL